jgi:O-antigen/teichoic acid export membrane protein
MLYFSFLSWIGSLGIVMFQTLDRVLVGMSLGASAAGVYSIATGVALRLAALAGQLTQVLVPFASSYQAEGRLLEIQSAFRYASRFVACVLAAAASILVIWMDVILSVWVSPQFANDYAVVFRIIVICYGVYPMVRPAHQIAQGMGWLGVPTGILIGSGLLMLLALWTFAQSLGLTGVSIANSVNSLVLSINVYVGSRLGLRPLASVGTDLGPPLLLLILAAIFAFADLSIAARLMASILIAASILWLALGRSRAQVLIRAIRSS